MLVRNTNTNIKIQMKLTKNLTILRIDIKIINTFAKPFL